MSLPSSLVTVTPFSKTIATLLLLILPYIGFQVGSYYRETNCIYEKALPVVVESFPQPPVKDNETWETYTNDVYGYSIKYPISWDVVEEGSQVRFIQPPVSWQGEFIINVSENTLNQSAEMIAAEMAEPPEPPELALYQYYADIMIDKKPAKQISRFRFDSSDIITISTNGNYKYELTYNNGSGNDPDLDDHLRIYNEMLTSFKYLNNHN